MSEDRLLQEIIIKINKLRIEEKKLLEKQCKKKRMQEERKAYLKLVRYFKSARFKKQQIKANEAVNTRSNNEHI